MIDRLDWTEQLTVGLTVVFVVTLALVVNVGNSTVWLLWGTAWVLIAGGSLVLVNRFEPPPNA